MNLKKLSKSILDIGIAFAVVFAPNIVKFENATNTPSVEVNNTLVIDKSSEQSLDSKHF
ncbi:MAG: hypothetical protein LBI63_05975 [Candidatus Ancillula sp.]|jgi:hypothetical protein|nr:hypothetical protein [Candidatus Ancillula sp.]